MTVGKLLEKVTTDPAFADRLKVDPESVLRSIDVEPTPGVLEAVAATANRWLLGSAKQRFVESVVRSWSPLRVPLILRVGTADRLIDRLRQGHTRSTPPW